jgi:hypothetical protein
MAVAGGFPFRMLSRGSTSSHQRDGGASVGDKVVIEEDAKAVAVWPHRRCGSDGHRTQERYICLNQWSGNNILDNSCR